MKKLLGILLAGAIAMTVFAGCRNTSSSSSSSNETTTKVTNETSAAEKQLVGFAISYTGNDFMQALADGVKNKFIENGYDCEVAVANGDATKQIEQIENFTTMGAKLIIVMAVDPTGLTDVCKRARDAGVKIVAFTTDVGEQDIYLGSASEKEIGAGVAKLASDWIDKTFPNEKEVEAVVFGYSGTPEAAQRSEGIKEIATMNSKVKMTYIEPASNTLDAAQQSAENLFQTNPNVKVILCYNSGMSNGVNAYVMSAGSAVKDKAAFATFGSDFSEEVISNIKASKTNESVVRGVVSLGTMDDILRDVFDNSKKITGRRRSSGKGNRQNNTY